MARLTHKIKAFTILESMVSMVIIMIVFGLSSIVMINMANSGITKDELEAHSLAKLLRNETIRQHRFIDESITEGEITIEKSILDFRGGQNIKVLLIEAYKGDEKMFENRELILINIK